MEEMLLILRLIPYELSLVRFSSSHYNYIMKIYLLTHERESKRPSNTGRIVTNTLRVNVKTVLWKRKDPDKELLQAINSDKTVLLFSQTEGNVVTDISSYENFIIIDGTWQEAKKIYNKSPYLKQMKTTKIQPDGKSLYSLRRNQKEDGLCTAECAIELLKLKGHAESAIKLSEAFKEFMKYWTIKENRP